MSASYFPSEPFTSSGSPADVLPSAVEPAGCVRPTKQARVLHLVNGEHYAGSERVQDLLAQRLPDYGYDIGFVTLKRGKFAERRQSQRTPLWEFPMRHRADLALVSRLARLVRREGFQLLHAHTPRSALVARLVAARNGLPLIYHVHSPTARDTTDSLRNRLNHLVEKLAIGGAQRLITVSHSLARHMIAEGAPKNRVSVVPNGVPRAVCHERPHPSSGTWVLGTVALFRPRKGIEVLLHALRLLKDQHLPARLRAVGPFETVEYEQRICALVRDLDLTADVEWTGFASDVAAELRQMDVFVLPSLFGEGLPMVVLEAMAHGVPVVATHVEGIPEAIRPGVDGLLAPPNDAVALASHLTDLMHGVHDWSALARQARARQREKFSDLSMAAGVAAVYGRVLPQEPACHD